MEDFEEVTFEGYVSSITRSEKTGKADINIYVGDSFDYSIFDAAFKSSPKQYIPKWYSTHSGFVNLHTKYKVPVLVVNEDNTQTTTDTDHIINDTLDLYHYRKTIVKVIIKQGATYPKALKILPEVAENNYNPFEGM